MDKKLTEALKKVLPDEQISEVASAVEAMMAEQVSQIEKEYSEKLDEAYEEFEAQNETNNQIAEQGYQQAYEIICDQQKRLDLMREEFEEAIEQGFEEAYQELEKEREKNNNIEVELYDEFDNKLKEMRDVMVDKIDQFLALQEAEIYETAKKEVVNDPRMLEHKVALDRVAEVVGSYLSDDDYSSVTSSKLDEASKNIEDLKAQVRMLESKNVRLNMQNTKLNEQVKEANGLLTEAASMNRKERQDKARTASGRGHRASTDDKILSEYNNPAATSDDGNRDLREEHEPANDLLVLSGIEQSG